MSSTRSVAEQLARLAGTAGGSALVTHYRPAVGERTELSASSFANWVDKTANLLDDLGIDADSEVVLPVLAEAPGHWMALIWPFALWQRGLTARVGTRSDAVGADLVVIGPDAPAPVGTDTLACSLHPWGLALAGLPAGVTDYSSEALAQPDASAPTPAAAGDVAWVDATRRVTFADLSALPPVAQRVLATPTEAWDAVSLLVRVVLGGGSLVVVEGDADVSRIAVQERALPVVG